MDSKPPITEDDLAGQSKVERIKAASNHLRGTIKAELLDPAPVFSEANAQLLKFHGIYQQEDRDRRKEARARGLDRHHIMMTRTRIPGGRVSPEGYLAHDSIAERWGNGTLRITTRQTFQIHGVLKGDLRAAIRAISEALMTTLGGCGDQQRNTMACPAPARDGFAREVGATLDRLVPALTPRTAAYHEIWIDNEIAADSRPAAEEEPLYGEQYLPRKFKTAIALEGDNCVDIYANDLGLVAMRSPEGGLAGFNVLVGGGLGRTAHKPETFPAVARPLAFVSEDQVIAVAQAVIGVQRDHGDRSNRRHARMKYLIHDRGLDWFRAEVQSRLDFKLREPRPMTWEPVDDHLGWHPGPEGSGYYGIYVENGRIKDEGDFRLRTALRSLVQELAPTIHLTPQQNLLVTGLTEADKDRLEAVLAEHGVPLAPELSNTLRSAMACPAMPTCGLAVAESERVLPGLIRELEGLVAEAGLADERISWRMTGCPNGCARPYLGDVGLVGTTLGKYDVYLGGDYDGTRLNQLYAPNVPIGEIPDLFRPLLYGFAAEREAGEGFGNWCHRVGVDAVRERFRQPEAQSA